MLKNMSVNCIVYFRNTNLTIAKELFFPSIDNTYVFNKTIILIIFL